MSQRIITLDSKESDPLREGIFPIVLEGEAPVRPINREWLSQPITDAIDNQWLVDEIKKGQLPAWRIFVKQAFRKQGMPEALGKWVQTDDRFVARYMANEFQRGMPHSALETHVRQKRFNDYFQKIGFRLVGEEKQDFVSDVLSAGQEMHEFGNHIIDVAEAERIHMIGSIATKHIVEDDIFIQPHI